MCRYLRLVHKFRQLTEHRLQLVGMEFIYAIILGTVEGITEFLPISSTGHLILVEKLLNIYPTDFWKSFIVIIQLGAILAVLILYWRKLLLNGEIFKKVALAFLPTAIVGLVLYPIIKQYLLGSVAVVLCVLALGGAAIILFERWYKELPEAVGNLDLITYRQAFIIGLAQSVAVVPGVSRAAATIMGGLFLGLSRHTIVEFSFLLAVPTMAAATGFDLFKIGFQFSSSEWLVLFIGFVFSFLSAMFAVRWLLRYVSHHDLTAFGWYRIILAVLLAIVFYI